MSQTTTISTENSKPMKSKKKKIKLIIVDDNAEEKATTIQSRWRGYHFRNKKLLEPCNISEIDMDIQKLKERLINDYLTPGMMEYYKSTATKNLNLDDGFMEYVTARCINGERVGEGHCPVDVIKDERGIDVLCVCLNGSSTNEKSIMQNFRKCGNNLDNLFETGEFQKALNVYIKEYYKKLLNAKKSRKLNKLYYCAFISTSTSVYLSVFKINLDCVLNIKYENITKQKKSIKFNGFIDEKFGVTTLFKSKKRLEIRLNKEILDCHNTIQVYSLNDTV